MRVAVHQDDGVFAYKLGRIVDGQHNHNLATGESQSIDDVVNGLVNQAKEEFPDAEVVVERLHDKGDETSEWVPANSEYTPVESSDVHDHELLTESNVELDTD